MKTAKKRNSLRLLILLLMMCMVVSLIPATALANNAVFYYDVPFTKTVVQGGTDSPGPMTFDFEVVPVDDQIEDIPGTYVNVQNIRTDGAGTYSGTLKVAGRPDYIQRVGGFKIREKRGTEAGWTYDEKEYIFTFEQNRYGSYFEKLTDLDGHDVERVEFTNTYTAGAPVQPDNIKRIPISKTVVQDGTDAPKAGNFDFDVVPVNPVASLDGLIISGNKIATNGTGTFNGILSVIGDPAIITAAGGLKITEKNSGADNWYYDEKAFTATLDGTGELEYLQYDDSSLTGVGTAATEISFENIYTPPTVIEVAITKTVLQGANDAPGAKTFEFDVAPETAGTDISNLTITGTSIDTNGAGTYSTKLKIVGTTEDIAAAGKLKITEKNDSAANWTYDNKTYSLEYDTNWRTITLTYDDPDDPGEQNTNTIAFTNTYTAGNPVSADNIHDIPISKEVEQLSNVEPEKETFEIKVEPVNEGVDISGLTITGNRIEAAGICDLNNSTYEGILRIIGDPTIIDNAGGLKITEKDGNAEYWSYDEIVYYYSRVNAASDFILETKSPYDGQMITHHGPAQFTNSYNAASLEVPIYKTVLQGGTASPQTKTFEFEIAPYGGVLGDPDTDISSLKISGNTITTNGAGVYSGTLKIVGDSNVINAAGGLKITEKNDGAANWTYDNIVYQADIEFAGVSLQYEDQDDGNMLKTAEQASFTNTYSSDTPGGGGGTIVVPAMYTLTFETNGGSHLTSIMRTRGSVVSLDGYVPTKEGNIFDGWYSEASLTNKVTTVTFDEDKTVYAGWTGETAPDTDAPTDPQNTPQTDPPADEETVYDTDSPTGTTSNVDRPINDVPKTDDITNINFWITLALCSMLGAIITIIFKNPLYLKRD